MLGVDCFLKKFRDQRKESGKMIACEIEEEKKKCSCLLLFSEWRDTIQVPRQNDKNS